MRLTNQELENIYGGGATGLLIFAGIIAFGILIAGIIDGYVRPLKCHE